MIAVELSAATAEVICSSSTQSMTIYYVIVLYLYCQFSSYVGVLTALITFLKSG